MIGRAVTAIVSWAERRAPWVIVGSLVIIALLLGLARRLEVRSDLLELLPTGSPAFRALEHQMGRVGGGATLILIVSSPDRAANERFVDDLSARLEDYKKTHASIGWVESGTKDVRAYYEANKWLYADLADLEQADRDLDRQIALRSGMVVDLLSDAPAPAPEKQQTEKKPALGLDDHLTRWEDRAARKDTFPTGYFATPDGKLLGVRIVTNTRLGAADGDRLLADVQGIVRELEPGKRNPEMVVGYTGDVASASDEKKALVSEAAWATAAAIVIVLSAIVLYFRSPSALVVIGFPVLFGISGAYAFAEIAFGYVNATGLFLGAIILGNGINYPIVLLSRYQEFRARGMEPPVARREAVLNALRAELVGACVAAIAYGSLFITHFRGFSQFGAIGFVGMLLVWAAIVPLVPALLVVIEKIQPRLPAFLRDRPATLRRDGSRSAITRTIAVATTRAPWVFVILGVALTVLAAWRLPSYVLDPWEYDFGRLGSRKSDVSGAGEWSNKANDVFGGKMNIAGAMMLADTPEQVPILKAQMLANDRKDPQGTMIAEITTIDDLLPGSPEEQRQKLAVLRKIAGRLSEGVLANLEPDERARVLRAKPPPTLRELGAKDLPPLLARRFSENDGRVGTVLYVKPKDDVVFADGHNHLRLSRTTDNVELPDGKVVMTASRSTIFAEVLRSMRRDGPLISAVALGAVALVVIVFSRDKRTAAAVIGALVVAVIWLLGWAAWSGIRVNYVNFIAFPITFGIGCEYPFNIADRARLLGGDVKEALARSSGAVILCSFTTVVGYGSLMFSDFQALESFGKLAVCGEIACIFGAVFLLPSLMVLVGKRKNGGEGPARVGV